MPVTLAGIDIVEKEDIIVCAACIYIQISAMDKIHSKQNQSRHTCTSCRLTKDYPAQQGIAQVYWSNLCIPNYLQ